MITHRSVPQLHRLAGQLLRGLQSPHSAQAGAAAAVADVSAGRTMPAWVVSDLCVCHVYLQSAWVVSDLCVSHSFAFQRGSCLTYVCHVYLHFSVGRV